MFVFQQQFGLFAAVAQSASETARHLVVYELGRFDQFDDPRTLWLLLAVGVVAMLLYVRWFYRREKSQVPTALRWLLPCLRMLAIAGMVLFFLNPVKRIDQQVTTDSHVLLLVDTSQSMSVEDESTDDASKTTRAAAVVETLTESPLVELFREQHDVALAVFDERFENIWRKRRKTLEEKPQAKSQENESTGMTASNWDQKLEPRGLETRLGDALLEALDFPIGSPLAGILLFSDGGANSGIEPLVIAEKAAEYQVPIYAIGVGSTESRRNMRVQELSAPARVYPGDHTTVNALIHAEGFAGNTVKVELLARESNSKEASAVLINQQQISFDQQSQVLPMQFVIEPAEIGRLALELKISAPVDDQYVADNRREVEVEVVESDTRVLLLASGATRDYRFLRNQLRRDKHATVDVLLQSAQPGISQDANKILDDFPRTKEDLYQYDCIVAFDPNWSLLDAQQVELLEMWVAEEAGGMILIAGPIHTASWVQSPEHTKIRALYPVEFQRRLTLLDDGIYGSKTPWPIEFSRDGRESNYLWLADSANASRDLWSEFRGVFGCYAVKGPKPGARVLGRYSDPDAGLSTERPVYLAEHFYGSGRVFYMGSGELWRLRNLDIGYFEILYTSLIRHVSQGRLLRGSSHGHLLTERDHYSIGDDVVLRAQLLTTSREPLIADRVTAHVVTPEGKSLSVILHADKDRVGNFVGQFSVRSQGSYRVELPVPDSLDEQLVKRIQVVLPDLEFDKTRRDEGLLASLANRSGGKYYANLEAAILGNKDLSAVTQLIPSRAEMKTLRGTPDIEFTEWLHGILLAVLAGSLGLEWFLRRLVRLA